MLSPDEYEALPPSIQKKYFSSKEGLEIAKQASCQKRKRQATKGTWLALPSPTEFPRPATSEGILRLSSHILANESKLSLIDVHQETVSEEQAKWFLMLPDKVRKQYFSREEQIALTVRCKKVLEHLSPELARDVYHRCLSITRDDRQACVSKQRPSTSAESRSDESKSFLTIDSCSNVSHPNTNKEIEIFELYTPPPGLETTGQGSSLTPRTPPSEPKTLASIDKPKRKSLHRKISLTPLPLPPPTLAPPVPPIPSIPLIDPISHFARSAGLPRPSIEEAATSPAPSAERKHYQDPDARKQLRNALASPENFDDAVAFGFSSTDDSMPVMADIEQSFPIQQPPLCDSEREDEDCHSIETSGPRTPTPFSDNEAAVRQPSSDSSVEFPVIQTTRPKTPTTRSPAGSFGNREMTIHMTLTRQDLRSPEQKLYSVQRQQMSGVAGEYVDPLALETLPVCDDPTGAHGAFAVQDGMLPKGLKRVWKTLTRH